MKIIELLQFFNFDERTAYLISILNMFYLALSSGFCTCGTGITRLAVIEFHLAKIKH